MFTGCGALIALALFLPLPARFQNSGLEPGRALQHSFYIVAAVALVLAIWCFFGLRKLAYEDRISSIAEDGSTFSQQIRQLFSNLDIALRAPFRRKDIALGYVGGFVARASSVGISLFIPLLVNAMFLQSDLCKPEQALGDNPGGLPDLKRKCPRAYVVAASMTGICETVALVAAPVFGYVSARSRRRGLPMMVAAAAGIIGYPLFATQFDPDSTKKGERALAFLGVCLIGISQIGAIVCSLGVLSAGVLAEAREHHGSTSATNGTASHANNAAAEGAYGERDALLGNTNVQDMAESGGDKKNNALPLSQLKGAVAGIYSFYGGAAILILTKVGGVLFDKVDVGSPFFIMAGFNAVLFFVCAGIGLGKQDD
jgi:hypothetical protein